MRRHGKTAPDSDPADAGANLSEFYERHGAMVRGLCSVLLRHRHEAEDAAQQTFLSAYRSMLSGNVPQHPAAWLATIARNECVARIQRRMREPLPSAGSEDTLPDPVAVAAKRADLAELWQAIAELPERRTYGARASRSFLIRRVSSQTRCRVGRMRRSTICAWSILTAKPRSALSRARGWRTSYGA